jgi:hypothetical protein
MTADVPINRRYIPLPADVQAEAKQAATVPDREGMWCVCGGQVDVFAFGFRCRLCGSGDEPYPTVVLDVAKRRGLEVRALDWHVEAEHGWEPHDVGYADAVEAAAQCMAAGGCDSGAVLDALGPDVPPSS